MQGNPGNKRCQYLITAVVGEIEFCLFDAERHPWFLVHELNVYSFSGLHAHHEFIPLCLTSEDVPGNVAVLNANLSFALI